MGCEFGVSHFLKVNWKVNSENVFISLVFVTNMTEDERFKLSLFNLHLYSVLRVTLHAIVINDRFLFRLFMFKAYSI